MTHWHCLTSDRPLLLASLYQETQMQLHWKACCLSLLHQLVCLLFLISNLKIIQTAKFKRNSRKNGNNLYNEVVKQVFDLTKRYTKSNSLSLFPPRKATWRYFQRPVSRKSRNLFGPKKPFIKVWAAYSVKLIFSYVVKGIKIKITTEFRATRHLCFENTRRIMSPEMCS